MKYKAAIFDLDGTLVNSLEDIAHAANHVLEHYNVPLVPVDEYRFHVGAGVEPLMRNVLGAKNAQYLDDALAMWHEYYSAHSSVHTRPYDGIEELLNKLAENNLKLAVLSNKVDEETRQVVGALLSKHKFEIVRGHVKGVPPKPDTTSAKQILKTLDLRPEQCLYVGDTKTDMLTGKSAGMFTVGVSWGFRDRKELADNGADAIIDTPQELLQFIES